MHVLDPQECTALTSAAVLLHMHLWPLGVGEDTTPTFEKILLLHIRTDSLEHPQDSTEVTYTDIQNLP